MDSGFSPFDPDGFENEGDESRGPRLRDISFRMMVPNIITALAICAGLTGIRLASNSALNWPWRWFCWQPFSMPLTGALRGC